MGQDVTSSLKAWRDRIAVMCIVREEIQRSDTAGLWQYHYPEAPATEAQVEAAEARLGYKLDPSYRDFLRCANGWKCVMQSVSLFGTADLMGSELMRYAMNLLDVMDDTFPLVESSGFTKAELLPIAATPEDQDLHVITKPGMDQAGMVIWFVGQEIERYPNFEEYFLAMVDYNRLEITGSEARNT